MKTNNFTILIKCEENFTANNFSFQKLKSNAVEKLDEILSEKIDRFVG